MKPHAGRYQMYRMDHVVDPAVSLTIEVYNSVVDPDAAGTWYMMNDSNVVRSRWSWTGPGSRLY